MSTKRPWQIIGRPSAALLCLAPVLFLIAARYESADRWKPVSGLMPGAYATATITFDVKVPGDYHLELTKYITEEQQASDSLATNGIACNLRMTIFHFGDVVRSDEVVSLSRTRRNGYEGLDYYEGEPFNIPESGRYVIQLDSKAYSPLLAFGALFSIKSEENEEQSKATARLAASAGKWSVRVGIAGLVICTGWPSSRKRRRQGHKLNSEIGIGGTTIVSDN